MDGWMDGWMDGRESGVKDCLQQSKINQDLNWCPKLLIDCRTGFDGCMDGYDGQA
jgi:hypothetical protein